MNFKEPFFSIVIVNYNGGSYLEEAVLSVLNQKNADFELIIVDAESKDDSIEIIKKYEHKIAWWVSEKDNGQSQAFNKGFAKAKGKYLFWINSDDLLLQNSLHYAKEIIIKNPHYEWFTANTIFFNSNGIVRRCARGPAWNPLLNRNAPINVYGPTSIFEKNIFEKVLGFDEDLHFTMDTDLWMRFNKKGIKFKRINKYFWGFRIHSESKTSHAFNEKASPAFSSERLLIQQKNDHIYKPVGLLLQKMYKLIAGVYLRSWIDTKRFAGKKIDKFL
jgi:glycosyltransferase involved in cell wall biosynthesis